MDKKTTLFDRKGVKSNKLSLHDYLLGEVLGTDLESADIKRHERVHNFLRVPMELEKVFRI